MKNGKKKRKEKVNENCQLDHLMRGLLGPSLGMEGGDWTITLAYIW